MFKDKKVIVVMPAYNAGQTLCKTYEEVMAKMNLITSHLFPDQK